MADDVKKQAQFNKELEKTLILQKKIIGGWKEQGKESKKYLTIVDDLLDNTTDELEDMHKAIRGLHFKGALKIDSAVALRVELQELAKQIEKIKELKGPLDGAALDAQKQKIAALNKNVGETKNKIAVAQEKSKGFIDAMEKFGPSFMKGWAGFRKSAAEGQTSIQGFGGLFEKAGDSLNKLPKGLKWTGAAAKGLGSSLGGIAKIFASWPGAILMGVVALGKLVIAADQVVKDANKAFAMVRGPDIMTSDIKKQFSDFNKAIYNAADNLSVGMDVSQIRSLMEAMTSAGLNITRLNEGLLTYRNAIYVSAKASRALGMDIAWVGAKIGDMITDFRMNMETIDKTFIQVAFDAKKSGVSTDRFWSAIQNATSSMALYGVFMGAASKTVKRFTEDMVGGAKDAEDATGDMFGIFKSGSLEGQAAVLDFAKNAGANISGMFKKMSSEFEGKALNIKARIENLEGEKQTEEVRDQLQKLRSEYSDYQSKNMRYSKMIGKNSVVQASEMTALAGDAPEIMLSAIRGISQVGDLTQVSGERMLVAIKAGNEMGVSEKTIRMLVEQAKMTKEKINMLVKDSVKYFDSSKLKDKNAGKTLAAKLKETLEAEGQGQIKKSDELAALMAQSLEMPPDQAKMFAEMAISDKTRGEEIAGLLADGNKDSVKALLDIMDSSGILNDFQAFKFKQDEKAQGELEKAAEDNLKNIVKSTLSLKEMADIVKDDAKYRLSSLGFMQSISSAAGDILGVLLKAKPQMTESQKAAQQMAVSGINQNEYLKSLLNLDRDNNIKAASQQVLTEEVVKKITELNKEIATQQKIGRVLEEAGSAEAKGGGGGLQVIKDAITNIETALKEDKLSPQDFAKKYGKDAVQKDKLSTDEERALTEQLVALEGVRSGLKNVMPKKQGAYLASIAEKNTKSLKENVVQNTKLKDIRDNLITMNKTNQTIADFTEAQILADPKAMAVIAEQIKAEYGEGGMTFQDEADKVLKKYGANVTRGLATTQREDSEGKKTDIFSTHQKGWLESAASNAPSLQGLKIPEMVTAPGSVILHTGEMILPKGYENIGTLPVQQTAGAGGTAGASQKTININVTATERDLAQKIANEIRSVMYNDHIPN